MDASAASLSSSLSMRLRLNRTESMNMTQHISTTMDVAMATIAVAAMGPSVAAHMAIAMPLFLYEAMRMSATLCPHGRPARLSPNSIRFPSPNDLRAAITANTTRIDTVDVEKSVDPTESHTSTNMQQFMKTDMKSLLSSNLVRSLETTSGMAMISTTAMSTCIMSTDSPRVSQTMNGIHTRDRM